MYKNYDELVEINEEWYKFIYADTLLLLLEESLDEGY